MSLGLGCKPVDSEARAWSPWWSVSVGSTAAALVCLLFPWPALGEAAPSEMTRTKTEHFTFVHRARHWPALRTTASVAEEARLQIVSDLGIAADAPVAEVRLARDVEEMRRLCPRPPPPWADAVAFWPDNVIVLSLVTTHHRPVSLETTFRHELAHLALRWAVGDVQVPRWFTEGLAVLQSDELPLPRLRVLWPAVVGGNLLPLSQLDRRFPAREFRVNLAYAQSADFVRYLVVRGGRWRLEELVGRVRGGEAFYPAMSATWGATVRSLELAWHEDLQRRYSVVPSLSAGATLWGVAALLAVLAYVRRRREIVRRIAAMPDEE